jgi:hypothetical protein|tara:strand:+ start:45 stop:302 length:258 start_codon:yes stop_codon:yes gene_type:complete
MSAALRGGVCLVSCLTILMALLELTKGAARNRAALGSEFPLSFDSDLRSREYALKALFCGADFVFFGRILQYDKIAAGNPRLEQL